MTKTKLFGKGTDMTETINKKDLALDKKAFFALYGREKTVAAYTLGCKVNAYDTQAALEILSESGFAIVPFEAKADVYIINTCTVTSLSDSKSRQMIHRAKKNNENSLIICMGCYAQRDPEFFIEEIGADIVLGNKNRKNIMNYIEQACNEQKVNAVLNIDNDRDFEEIEIKSFEERSRAFLKIEEGCDHFCSYCIIPYARGRVRSRTLDNIVLQAERLAGAGYKEIVLTGINLSWFGKDTGEKLEDVILKLNNIDKLERIRIGSIEPGIFTDEFLKKISKAQKLCNHFHISLQSGSDAVLDRMRRGYSADEYKKEIENIRIYFNDAGITTDVMTGFPGETEQEFLETCEFVKEIGFSRLHVFPFSAREGTKAFKMDGQLPNKIKKERANKLIEIGHGLENAFIAKNLNSLQNVLFEQMNADILEGYTENYIKVHAKGSIDDLHKIKPTLLINIKDNVCCGDIK